MIYINSTIVSNNLYIESITGLYDFPDMKAAEVNWLDRNQVEFDDSEKAVQFKERKIKINCFITAASYGAALTQYANVQSALSFDGLGVMTLPTYSNRAYLVFLSKATNIKTNYSNTNTIFRFTLEFTEPQPFNVQFYYPVGATPVSLTLSIGKVSPGLSTASERQKYINVTFQGTTTEQNIEQGTFDFTGLLAANTNHFCIITGEIDEIEYLFTSITPSYNVIGAYYLRSGISI